MTYKVGNHIVIEAEEPDECTMCHKMKELRPAGVDGARVCLDCARKNPEALNQYRDRLFGRVQ